MATATKATIDRTIGGTNGRWSLLFRTVLIIVPLTVSLLVPLGAWLVVNQVRDNEFRNTGDRWTATQATAQTKAIISEVMLAWRKAQYEHEALPGHSVMDQRVAFIERLFPRIKEENAARNEILRELQMDIREYIEWVKENQQ